MRFSKRSLRPRTSRAFSISAFGCENLLELRSLAVPLLTITGGDISAQALDSGASAGFNYVTATLTASATAGTSGIVTVDEDGGDDDGGDDDGDGGDDDGDETVGSFAGTDTAGSVVTTTAGPSGASTITLAGALNGTLSGSCSAGALPGVGVAASTYSGTGGTPSALTWTTGNSNPSLNTGTVTYTLSVHGESGINSTTSASMAGVAQLFINTPDFTVNMNTNSVIGLAITQFNPAMAMSTTVYTGPTADGSNFGQILYNPGAPEADGSSSFSAFWQQSFPIATTGGGFAVTYFSSLQEGANPGISAGESVLADPIFEWSLDVDTY